MRFEYSCPNFIATSEGVNIEELVDDFVTFYVAGQETTSSLLSFALILTLQNPHVLERYNNLSYFTHVVSVHNTQPCSHNM